ncbi:MAG: glycosyltransferase [Candidatus Acidiferrales bacterium]
MTSSFLTGSIVSRDHRAQAGQIIGLFPAILGVGGVQEAARMTVAALSDIFKEQDVKAHLLSLNDARRTQVVNVNGSRVSLRGFGRSKVRFVLSAISRARSLRKRRAGIIIAAHPYLAVPAALMGRFAPGMKIVVMAHGVEVWNTLSPLRRRALMRACIVLAPSRFTAQKLEEVQGVPPDKIRLLAWPLDPDFLRLIQRGAEVSIPAQFPHGRIILTVGRWAASEQYKGADELIHAVALLRPSNPDLQLVAVGSGDDLPRLKALATSLRIADCVSFFEGLSREHIAACYCRADIFALPSTGEGFGLVFLEAMASAKPVVGAAYGGTMDVVEDGVNGLLVPPKDAQKLANALDSLLRDKSLCMRLGQTGAEIVQTKYAFHVFERRLKAVLDECGSADAAHF